MDGMPVPLRVIPGWLKITVAVGIAGWIGWAVIRSLPWRSMDLTTCPASSQMGAGWSLPSRIQSNISQMMINPLVKAPRGTKNEEVARDRRRGYYRDESRPAKEKKNPRGNGCR
jgi:hypothetical protein